MRTLFIDPGMLSHELVLEEPVETPDGAGGFTIVWSALATVWAQAGAAQSGDRNLGGPRPVRTDPPRHAAPPRRMCARACGFANLTRLFPILAVQDADETGRYLICRTREETE